MERASKRKAPVRGSIRDCVPMATSRHEAKVAPTAGSQAMIHLRNTDPTMIRCDENIAITPCLNDTIYILPSDDDIVPKSLYGDNTDRLLAHSVNAAYKSSGSYNSCFCMFSRYPTAAFVAPVNSKMNMMKQDPIHLK
jgi:hypothetical protein